MAKEYRVDTMKILAIKSYLICATISLAVGFSVGFYTKSRFVKAERSEALSDARKTDVMIVADAAKRSERVSEALQQNKDFFAFKQAEFDALPNLIEQLKNDQTTFVCPSNPVLSSDLIKLLNANP